MKKLLATLLILCAGPVWAEWVEYGKTEDGDRHYFDPSTIKGRDIKRVWTRAELRTKNSSGWHSGRSLRELDCLNERSRGLQSDTFAQPNLTELHERWSGPGDWSYPAPETVEKTLFDLICGKK